MTAARKESVRPYETGFAGVVDRIPVGMIWFDHLGRRAEFNEQAAAMLDSPRGPELDAAITRAVNGVRASGEAANLVFDLSGESLHVTIGPDRVPGSFLAVLQRARSESSQSESQVLRNFLEAFGTPGARTQAIGAALNAVRNLSSLSAIGFFEVESGGRHLRRVAWAGAAVPEVARISAEERTCALVRVLHTRQTLQHRANTETAGTLPWSLSTEHSFVALPVGQPTCRGVLYAAAPAETLSLGTLRLLQVLSAAVGSLLELNAIEDEANRAREIASQRDRLATIGQLVAGVAHEINNPLAFLKSNLHSLKSEVDDLRRQPTAVSEVDQIIEESLDGVARIESLVQALKGTSRQQHERVRFDPSRALSEAVTIFRGAKKQDCDIDCDLGHMPEVIGAPSAMGQIALNLLQNGLDAMQGLERRRRKLEVRSTFENDHVHLFFTDHGTGIPPEVQARIFEAFYTTKGVGKGTGLGLYICQELIAAMGGSIRFTTGPLGTTFELVIPAGDLVEAETATAPTLGTKT